MCVFANRIQRSCPLLIFHGAKARDSRQHIEEREYYQGVDTLYNLIA